MHGTHRVSVAWLHEQHVREDVDFDSVSTDGMAADALTKSTHVLAKWIEARKLINVFASADELMSLVTSKRSGHQVTVVACLCSQSFGSDALCLQSAGDRAAPPTLCDRDCHMATEEPQLRLRA